MELPRCSRCHRKRHTIDEEFCGFCLRACRRKCAYVDEDTALRAYRRVLKWPWDDPTLMQYKCEICGNWHLGHRPWPKPNAKRMAEQAEKLRRKALLKAAGF